MSAQVIGYDWGVNKAETNREAMRYTVILVPADEAWVSVSVPAMPGCVSQGRTREEALANGREAMDAWMQAEAEHGRGPLPETPEMVLEGVAQALQIIDEMRAAGEWPPEAGYHLELATVEHRQPIAA